MTRTHRSLLLVALLGFTFALSSLPSASAAEVSFGFCSITAHGLGYTESEAIDNAEAYLFANYFVTSYRVVASDCDYDSRAHDLGLPTCYAELSACGFRRPRFS